MKNLFVSTLLVVFVITSCQQKQYANVQKGNLENHELSKRFSRKEASGVINSITTGSETSISTVNQEILPFGKVNIGEQSFESNNNISEKRVLELNQEDLNTTFEKLNKIEIYIEENEDIDFEKLEETTDLLKDLNLDTNTLATITKDEELPLNIPAFFWGCCLGGLIVYMLTEDKIQTKKAVYGCLVAGGVVAVIYVVLIILGLSSSFYFY